MSRFCTLVDEQIMPKCDENKKVCLHKMQSSKWLLFSPHFGAFCAYISTNPQNTINIFYIIVLLKEIFFPCRVFFLFNLATECALDIWKWFLWHHSYFCSDSYKTWLWTTKLHVIFQLFVKLKILRRMRNMRYFVKSCWVKTIESILLLNIKTFFA